MEPVQRLDLGPEVAHLALREGVPVYDPDGRRVGVVDRVMTDEATGIFDGIVIHTLPLPGRHLYAGYQQVAELHERGVLLATSADRLSVLGKRRRRPRDGDQPLESSLEAILRRAWDRITGMR
jgi:hypothetical protein